MDELVKPKNLWKIKDNKIIILNAINRTRYKINPYCRLISPLEVEQMLDRKQKLLGISRVEASEVLKKEVLAQLKAELAKYEK